MRVVKSIEENLDEFSGSNLEDYNNQKAHVGLISRILTTPRSNNQSSPLNILNGENRNPKSHELERFSSRIDKRATNLVQVSSYFDGDKEGSLMGDN